MLELLEDLNPVLGIRWRGQQMPERVQVPDRCSCTLSHCLNMTSWQQWGGGRQPLTQHKQLNMACGRAIRSSSCRSAVQKHWRCWKAPYTCISCWKWGHIHRNVGMLRKLMLSVLWEYLAMHSIRIPVYEWHQYNLYKPSIYNSEILGTAPIINIRREQHSSYAGEHEWYMLQN